MVPVDPAHLRGRDVHVHLGTRAAPQALLELHHVGLDRELLLRLLPELRAGDAALGEQGLGGDPLAGGLLDLLHHRPEAVLDHPVQELVPDGDAAALGLPHEHQQPRPLLQRPVELALELRGVLPGARPPISRASRRLVMTSPSTTARSTSSSWPGASAGAPSADGAPGGRLPGGRRGSRPGSGSRWRRRRGGARRRSQGARRGIAEG